MTKFETKNAIKDGKNQQCQLVMRNHLIFATLIISRFSSAVDSLKRQPVIHCAQIIQSKCTVKPVYKTAIRSRGTGDTPYTYTGVVRAISDHLFLITSWSGQILRVHFKSL